MDKYEYKVRADEIKALIAEGDYVEAVKIADTIDWRRVKSVMMLCTISDLYKINRRYQESKDILLLAYEKHPAGRLIVYSLCELSIKMEEYVQAVEYYKEFSQIAPKDTGRFILQYRLYEAQDVSLEERIAVLEEFKKRDYREKWAYELAYLYHRIGLTTKCVEECDEMYLWFGEGRYVLKAMELKALHTPLTAEQQEKYDMWMLERDAGDDDEEDDDDDIDIDGEDDDDSGEEDDDMEPDDEEEDEDDGEEDDDEEEDDDGIRVLPTTELPEVKTIDMGQYNTLNLQMALAESMKEILSDDAEEPDAETEQEEASAEAKTKEITLEETEPEETEAEEDSQKERDAAIVEQIIAPLLQETMKIPKVEEVKEPDRETDELQEIVTEDAKEILEQMKQETITGKIPAAQVEREAAPNRIIDDGRATKYDNVLAQENDGQIRLVVPDVKAIEKQITGQLSIEDVLAEWEIMKKSNEQKRMEEVRQRILESTGSLFADFDEATKSGLLEQLEKAFVAAIMKESGKTPAIKKVVLPDDLDEEPKAPVQPKPKQEPVRTARKEEPVRVVEKEEAVEAVRRPEPIPEPEEDDELTAEEETAAEAAAEEEISFRELENLEELEELEEIGASGAKEPEEAKETPAPPRHGASQAGRELTDEEKELFGQYVHHRKSREQLINTLDNMSMAAYIGNVIITGEEGGGTLSLAKGLIREMQYNDGNFSGKVAKISGAVLNKKDIGETLGRINNGALIIEKAAGLKEETVSKLGKELERDNIGLLIIMEDTKQAMNRLLAENSVLNNSFNLRIDIEPLDDEALVAYAKQYAEQMEYSIDEFGVLALHTRIADMQTSDHEVSVAEVRELVDEAIYYANKKTPKHFVDILLAKRYDDEDMIILRENDFMHY